MITQKHFLSRVQKTDKCWLWAGAKDKDGYGSVSIAHGDKRRAHRISFELFLGKTKGLDVLHKCDTPACVNPKHLFLGTKTDNAKDRDSKGRQAKGERAGCSKLTESQAIEIHKLYSQGVRVKELCKRFNVSRSIPLWIATGKKWTYLNLPILKPQKQASGNNHPKRIAFLQRTN